MPTSLLRRCSKPHLDLVTALFVVVCATAASGCSSTSATIGRPPGDSGAPSDSSTTMNNPSDGACTQTGACLPNGHWDPTQCACVLDGGAPFPDSGPGDATGGAVDGCVENVLCIATDRWDPVLCKCVSNTGGPDSSAVEGGDGTPDATDAGTGGCAQVAPCTTGFTWDVARCACVGPAGLCISGQGGHCLGFTTKQCTCMAGLTCHLARIADIGGTCEP